MSGYRYLELLSSGPVSVVRLLNHRPFYDPGINELVAEWNAVADLAACHTLLVDCSNVEIASSEMLAKLISLQRRLKRKAGRLVLCGMRAGLRKVLTRTHLDQLLEIQDAPEEESARLDVCVSPRCKEPLVVLQGVGS